MIEPLSIAFYAVSAVVGGFIGLVVSVSAVTIAEILARKRPKR